MESEEPEIKSIQASKRDTQYWNELPDQFLIHAFFIACRRSDCFGTFYLSRDHGMVSNCSYFPYRGNGILLQKSGMEEILLFLFYFILKNSE